MSGDHDLWYVKTTDGDVDRMTLDQLDEAFNAGRIDENATVLPAGESRWVRLGTLLGLDQPATPSPVSFTPSFAPVPNSMRPVSIDLSDDDPEFAQLHKKSRKGVGFAVAAALLLIPAGLLGANRMHIHLGSSSADTNAAAAVQAPPPVTAAPPPPAPDPAPPAPATTAAATASEDNHLTDDQKAKLAAADKALESKMKARHKARSYSGGGGHHAKYKSQGFTSGGNKYDPLNSGI